MKKVVIGCLGAALLGALLVGVLVWLWLFRELPVLEATLSVPGQAVVDVPISMVVTATNPHKTAVTLDSIDIDDAFLEGFQVVGVDPEPTDTGRVPIIQQRSWSFGRSVEPGGSLAVTFQLRPVTEGHFSGDVDVCNPNQDFHTVLADIVVKSAAGEGSGR